MSLNQYNDPFHVDVWSESKGGSVVTVAGAPASAPTQQPTPSTTPASATPSSINPLMLMLAAVAVVTIIASIN